MTLSELRKAHPEKFYPQTWYAGEAFMEREAGYRSAPTRIERGYTADRAEFLPFAASLARAYVVDSANPIWARYIWTADVDSEGQRVYVGDNGKGFEIHRHIHITERFGIPIWD